MPSEVSIVGAHHDREPTVEELKRELAESREQQAVSTEILATISSSATDANQVFSKIAASAVRLCEAYDATIFRVDGDNLRIVAHHGPIPQGGTLPLTRGFVTSSAVLDRRTIHVADLHAESSEYPEGSDNAQLLGHRTILAVPLIRAGKAIGVIGIRRTEVRPFTDRQIDLVKTFADQAVIAIENTRLFEEVQEKTRDLSEALEHQTATSEVLKVISSSPGDLRSVFIAILDKARRLCQAPCGILWTYDGELLHAAAHCVPPAFAEFLRKPLPGSASDALMRIVRGGLGRQFADHLASDDYRAGNPLRRATVDLGGARTVVAVPIRKDANLLGIFVLYRQEVHLFTDKQVELVKNFADQAVIAIENTRLFEAEQARTREVTERTRELSESLEQQTATSEVLRVISSTPGELEAVFQVILENAVRLCEATFGMLFRFEEGAWRAVAMLGVPPAFADFWRRGPLQVGPRTGLGRIAATRQTVHFTDVTSEPAEPVFLAAIKLGGFRTAAGVPILNDKHLIGAIFIYRQEVRPFSDKQIALVTNFASQAVIAIENARLLNELRTRTDELAGSVGELRALGEVGQAVNSTLDVKQVLRTIVTKAVELSTTDAGAIYVFDDDRQEFRLRATYGMSEAMIATISDRHIGVGDANIGEAARRREPLQVADLREAPASALNDIILGAGYRALLVVPLLGPDRIVGALVVRRKRPGEFTPAVVSLMQNFADQSVIALENARLFEEIAQKSRELEIASQHKSQFVANMSHELRTPLAAILGYAELMQEGFYEPLGQKSLEALTRIRSNGKHLLGLINTVLDIAKIESGQFTLNMAEYAIESVVETVRSATESLAQNKKLSLKTEVAKSLPVGLGDEQRLTQVLLNLVGNAIKFTDTGEVRVTAKAVNGHFAVSVADTGPGIHAEHQTRIFDQFHQVDSSNTKAKGGTGLGLAIAKQIVEMHGGRLWVESTLGKGSIFQMKLPTRAEFRKRAP